MPSRGASLEGVVRLRDPGNEVVSPHQTTKILFEHTVIGGFAMKRDILD